MTTPLSCEAILVKEALSGFSAWLACLPDHGWPAVGYHNHDPVNLYCLKFLSSKVSKSQLGKI